VQTTIPLSNGRDLPLEYRMQNADARWQVYDVSLGGVRLVASYRAQFNKIVRSESYEALVGKLKAHQFAYASPAPGLLRQRRALSLGAGARYPAGAAATRGAPCRLSSTIR
jgi:hypothetical protein